MPVELHIPDAVYERLRERAAHTGCSIESLVLDAVETAFPPKSKKKARLAGPLITDMGERGPLYPTDETPHDLILP
jgi:hypothetical protein